MDIRANLQELMKTKNYSMRFVATAADVSISTLSMWMRNEYQGDNDKVTDKINNFLQLEKERINNDDLPISEISILKYIFEIARLCHTGGKIGVCAGRAGLGKTVAVKEYVKQNLNAILIESDSGYTPKSLLLEIHRRIGLSGKGSAYDLMRDVVEKLNHSGRLLIIDEAENLPHNALEISRRIHDKTGIGVLLVGRNILFENLRGFNNQYDQLYSRVKFHKALENLSVDDVEKILISAKQDPVLAESYLQYSDGNTRRLEHLMSLGASVAKRNGKTEVDSAVIKQTSKLLMV